MEEKTYPGSSYQNLFNYLHEEHSLTLLESEMNDLIEVVHKFHPAGAVWVKGSTWPPDHNTVHWRRIEDKKPLLIVGRNYQDNIIAQFGKIYTPDELEWLDEAGAPAAGRREDAVLLIKYIRENYKKRKDGWTDNFNIARLTDQGIYELFKQQKEK